MTVEREKIINLMHECADANGEFGIKNGITFYHAAIADFLKSPSQYLNNHATREAIKQARDEAIAEKTAQIVVLLMAMHEVDDVLFGDKIGFDHEFWQKAIAITPSQALEQFAQKVKSEAFESAAKLCDEYLIPDGETEAAWLINLTHVPTKQGCAAAIREMAKEQS